MIVISRRTLDNAQMSPIKRQGRCHDLVKTLKDFQKQFCLFLLQKTRPKHFQTSFLD